MSRLSWLSVPLLLASPLALAAEPAPEGGVQALVQARLVAPLKAHELRRSAFSRARPPATARRVRLPQGEALLRDQRGQDFVPFSVDVHRGLWMGEGEGPAGEWRQDDVTGCVYPASGELFVRRGSAHSPPEVLWGKRVAPRTDVCRVHPARS